MPKPSTQEQFARIVGITQPAVSQLIRKGILTRGAGVGQWLQEYLKNLRQQAAGHTSEYIDRDLIKERARLAARQSENLEIELARKRGDLMPRDLVGSVLSFHNATIRGRLLPIPNRLKAQHPNLPTAVIVSLKELIHETLIELSHVRLPAKIDERTRQYFLDLHAAAQRNGDSVGG